MQDPCQHTALPGNAMRAPTIEWTNHGRLRSTAVPATAATAVMHQRGSSSLPCSPRVPSRLKGHARAAQIPWVQAEVLKRLLPAAHLHIEEGGGHFAYYVCSKAAQKRALQLLLDSAVPPPARAGGALLQNGAKAAGGAWKN